MNLYKNTSNEQRNDLLEADVKIEDREYSKEEILQIKNSVTSYIFSKSKKDIGKEIDKFNSFLKI